MISTNLSKLSQFIGQENKSFSYQIINQNNLHEQIHQLRKDTAFFTVLFQEFRNNTHSFIKEVMGKICTFCYKIVKEKNYFESELVKSQKIQLNMKNEVIQLKQMIQQAMQDYQLELNSKVQRIKNLQEELQMMKTISSAHNKSKKYQQQIKIQQQRGTQRQSQLQIIQQESSHATYSSVVSMQDSKRSIKFQEKSLSQISQSNIAIGTNQDEGKKVNKQNNKIKNPKKQNNDLKYENKTIKTFIDHFRKTIEQSFSENNKGSQYKFKKDNITKQPLKEITYQNNHMAINNKYYIDGCKDKSKQNTSKNSRIVSICHEFQQQLSSSSSQSDLIVNQDSEKINIPKKFQVTNNNKMFARKKQPEYVSRIRTQPSPQAKQSPLSNYFSNSKGSMSQKRIFGDKKICERSYSNQDNKSSKSNKSSFSKEKIKITSKMIDEVSYGSKKPNPGSKNFVYLGGKTIFRKFLTDLKASFKKYTINICSAQNEIYYEGQRKSGLRQGRGSLFYKNGIIYEGVFRQNMKHGKGSVTLNGIPIYEGQWCNDKLQGEGYIKSMKRMSDSCSSVFNQSSYLGNFYDNKLHGVGTIFLNPKEKIVTKFIHGIPVGDLTYYNLHEIQFGVWPAQ